MRNHLEERRRGLACPITFRVTPTIELFKYGAGTRPNLDYIAYQQISSQVHNTIGLVSSSHTQPPVELLNFKTHRQRACGVRGTKHRRIQRLTDQHEPFREGVPLTEWSRTRVLRAMPDPLVSILTPSFNQGRWLADNLRSVAIQSYRRVEHIVMDAGSGDDSLETLRTFADERLVWKSEPDNGQSEAINKAFAISTGEIIGWLNSDDAYFDDSVIASVVALMKNRPDIDVVYGHAALVNGDGLILQMMWAPPYNYQLLRRINFIAQPAAYIRRSAIAGPMLVDESYDYTMDRELWLRLGRNHRFARLDRVLAIDRHHLSRKSYVNRDVGLRDTERLADLYAVPRWHRLHRVEQKLFKVIFRFAGVTLLPYAFGRALGFSGTVDSLPKLLLRQLVRRRAEMPLGKAEAKSGY
jgi:glycosyltransferase involved in cell wall biosynthesis